MGREGRGTAGGCNCVVITVLVRAAVQRGRGRVAGRGISRDDGWAVAGGGFAGGSCSRFSAPNKMK